MIDYEREIAKLKDDNELMRIKSLSSGGGVGATTSGGDKSVAPTTGQEKQISDLQALVKKKDTEITKLKDQAIKSKKENQETAAKASSAENALADEKNKVTKYLKEKDEALNSLRNARQQAERERFEKERFKSDLDQLISEKRGTGAGALSYSDLQTKLKELENDVYILQAQKKTVLAINPRT
jgi:DNA repair exonuclease SbcCD ATPase subunit